MKKLSIVKSHITESGLTQRELSLITKISEVKLSHIICGRAEASSKKELLSKVLEVFEEILFKK